MRHIRNPSGTYLDWKLLIVWMALGTTWASLFSEFLLQRLESHQSLLIFHRLLIIRCQAHAKRPTIFLEGHAALP